MKTVNINLENQNILVIGGGKKAYEMGKQFEYMKFTFPIASVSIMMFVICFLCIIVPKIVYRNICKSTIVDRLKKVE